MTTYSTNILVSFGMPVFNDLDYLPVALDALLAQSHDNFELIISDDCSTDGSEQVCREYAKKDPRIRYIRQTTNLGISRNLEFLLKEGKGKYFMWAGNDDLWSKDFVKVLVEELEKKEDCIVAFGKTIFIDHQGNQHPAEQPRNFNYEGSTPAIRLKKLWARVDDTFGYGLYRREQIAEARFPIWKWPNNKCAYNNIYPFLCFALSRGNYARTDDSRVIWYNRLKPEAKINHRIPFATTFVRQMLAFCLRRLNMILFAAGQIRKGSGSLVLALSTFPRLSYRWCLIPIYLETKRNWKMFRAGDLSFW